MAFTRREFGAVALAGGGSLGAQYATQVRYLTLDEARTALAAFPGEVLEAASRDRTIRERLKRGDADSVGNFALLGTSFTGHSRLTGTQMDAMHADEEALSRLIVARVQDLTRAVAKPGANERLQFVADWLKGQGIDAAVPANANRVGNTLLQNVLREMGELEDFEKAIAQAKRKADASAQLAAGSTLYRDRGLSLDTSFRPNCGIEQTLAELKARGVLSKVRRAGIVGPGLDFTDKRDGYDFYPVQTLQPFAVVDSLRRLGLADSSGPSVDIFDLSERVLGHIRRAGAHARAGSEYVVQVPLDGNTSWLANTSEYWRRFGGEIGVETKASPPPPGVAVGVRALRIRPDVVKLLQAIDLDIVTQREALPDDQKLDLVIATNVLVYYSPFEQALAVLNIAAMLRTGGVLVSNNAPPKFEGAPLRLAGSTSAKYSASADDGDQFFWHVR